MVSRDSYRLNARQLLNIKRWFNTWVNYIVLEIGAGFDTDGTCVYNLTGNDYWIYYWLICGEDNLESGLKYIAREMHDEQINVLIISNEGIIDTREINQERVAPKMYFKVGGIKPIMTASASPYITTTASTGLAMVESVDEDGTCTVRFSAPLEWAAMRLWGDVPERLQIIDKIE